MASATNELRPTVNKRLIIPTQMCDDKLSSCEYCRAKRERNLNKIVSTSPKVLPLSVGRCLSETRTRRSHGGVGVGDLSVVSRPPDFVKEFYFDDGARRYSRKRIRRATSETYENPSSLPAVHGRDRIAPLGLDDTDLASAIENRRGRWPEPRFKTYRTLPDGLHGVVL